MDQVHFQHSKQMCVKHEQKKIKFVQVNELSNSDDCPLFYCTDCINKDLSFKGINYLLISQIMKEGETTIIQKWPPVNDYSIIDKLIQYTEGQDQSSSYIRHINQYFTQFKDDFLRKVDICEKKMINRILEQPAQKDSILERYQEISQISKLRSILIEGEQNQSSQIHEQSCRKFISEIESQKQRNSELLSHLLEQCIEKDKLTNLEQPNLIKDYIFSFIDQIDFFDSKSVEKFSRNIEKQMESLSSSKIMKLVSNKSNFCSEDFLSQLQQLLDKINPLLHCVSVEKIHEENRNAIDFSGLNQTRLDLIKDFVDHQKKIESSNEYCQSIENTYEYQYLEQVLDSSANFMNNNLKGQLKKYLIDTYPLLKIINFTNATLDKDKFDCFRKLTDNELQNLYYLITKRQEIMKNNEFNSTKTKQIFIQIQNNLSCFYDAEEIFKRYPIFDLMKKKYNNINNPLEIKLLKTNLFDGNSRISISPENEIGINQSNYYGIYKNASKLINCVSDMVLQRDQKYIFRFQLKNSRQDSYGYYIGLMSNSKCDTEGGMHENLTCYLRKFNNEIQYYGGDGIDKHLKGDKLRLSRENEIEMRVWLGGQQLEILDYPNYQYKVGVEERYKNKLINLYDLKLYIGISQEQISVTLTSAFLVDEFPPN